MFELAGKRVWVAGHRGMVGGALLRRLATEPCEIVTIERRQLDLRRQSAVERFIRHSRPDAIVVAAARVGGILANQTRPAEFLYDNMMIAANIVAAAHENGVDRVLLLGSSCIYPRDAAQPIDETALLSGPLEATNEAYALAKIAGVQLARFYRRQFGRDYIAAMPSNLYGPGDNFDLGSGHVLPALLRKAHEAKERGDKQLVVWGSGRPRREFLHVDDCADALVLLLKSYSGDLPVNVGSGEEVRISELARLVCRVVGFEGTIVYDGSKPDGTPRKLMSSVRLQDMGWRPRIALEAGLRDLYAGYRAQLRMGVAA
jgi:GDP-L-fucose synthase